MAAWEQAEYDAAYQRNGAPSYRRNIIGPDGPNGISWWRNVATELGLKIPGLVNPASHVLVVGSGFGWLIETIVDDFGHDRIYGTDTSLWIAAEKATHARSDIAGRLLSIDVTASDARQQFRTAGAGQQGRFDWILCDLVTETIPAGELAAFLSALEGLLRPGGNVVHLVAAELDPALGGRHDETLGIRFRPIVDWQTEAPSHVWVDLHSIGSS